jgi:acetyl-CoA carboxylase biotin carboxyl carrier protein
MDIRKVKKLIELMEESDINEIEIKEGEEAVRISRGPRALAGPQIVAAPVQAQTTSAPQSSGPVDVSHLAEGDVMRAPMVGTFYRAPSATSPPFTDLGEAVKQGQTLCIIESMKMMNEILADKEGVVEAILVTNADNVEFDQPLFTIVSPDAPRSA